MGHGNGWRQRSNGKKKVAGMLKKVESSLPEAFFYKFDLKNLADIKD